MKLYISGIVFVWFIVSAIVLFTQSNLWSGLTALSLAIGLPLSIHNSDNFIPTTVVVLIFGVIGAFNEYWKTVEDPEHQYLNYVMETIGKGNYGEHGKNVRMACGVQAVMNSMLLSINLFKAIYYDAFLSAVDFIRNQFSSSPLNQCLVSVQELKNVYPNFGLNIPK
ncbi:MAG: hypothetical protein ACI9JN_000983 [Bacteroidia bacterium]|jgi:hypothetical protein